MSENQAVNLDSSCRRLRSFRANSVQNDLTPVLTPGDALTVWAMFETGSATAPMTGGTVYPRGYKSSLAIGLPEPVSVYGLLDIALAVRRTPGYERVRDALHRVHVLHLAPTVLKPEEDALYTLFCLALFVKLRSEAQYAWQR